MALDEDISGVVDNKHTKDLKRDNRSLVHTFESTSASNKHLISICDQQRKDIIGVFKAKDEMKDELHAQHIKTLTAEHAIEKAEHELNTLRASMGGVTSSSLAPPQQAQSSASLTAVEMSSAYTRTTLIDIISAGGPGL